MIEALSAQLKNVCGCRRLARAWASRLSSRQLAEYPPQIFRTGSYGRDRPFVLGFFGENRVLFEGVPAAVAVCSEVPNDGGHIDVPFAQWPIHSNSHSVAVSELTGLHSRRNRRVDVFQVQMCDPLGSLSCEVSRIRPTNEQMTGVQA